MEELKALASNLDTTWVLVGAALVFFMQAGFAMVETGLTRAKNAGNIIMKNLMDFSIGTPIYWFIGYGIMFGSTAPLFGKIDLFCMSTDDFATMIFQTVFCATSATIVSGAMAERTKFSAYCIYSALISLFVYPISGHWIWGGGWLAQLGFHDFAGSTAVHMVGGVAAFIGAAILGPRIGKYDKNGKPNAILGHSMTLAALGVFILWFCWFGFNGCSTLGMSGDSAAAAARIFYTTNLAAAMATVTVMIFTWLRYKKPDVSMTLNGSLAGLVAITAGCDTVTPAGAALIGIIAGFAVVLGIEFVDQKLKVDDPVGAVGVHGICGALGTVLTGLFAYYDFGSGEKLGLLYGGGFNFLGTQVLGVVSVIAWVAVTMTIIFTVLKKTIGLRASVTEEVDGLDIHEHGLASAYADFALVSSINNFGGAQYTAAEPLPEKPVHVDDAVPVQVKTPASPIASDTNLTKITIVAKQSKFDELKEALNDIGVTGMTVTNVLGCGIQKGKAEYYRGVQMDLNLLPKIQVDVVVSKVAPEKVIAAAKKALYTGHIGDGKIFVYNVANVIKVRTGEEGFDALQGEDFF
ncbi:MAG: ammonium transporter [Candidatus Choladocola sp.]|nr:ammonium transporter [Candidatus Choladocola sp.]